MAIYLVIALLALIVILLCIPMRQRPQLLRFIVGMSAAGLVFYYIGPILIAFVVGAYTSVAGRVGWRMTFTLTAGVVFLLGCLWAWRSDKKDNAAIRAGSVEAFNERVKDLQAGPLKYTHEQAVAAANRIRNGED
jgi:hypothetical protein